MLRKLQIESTIPLDLVEHLEFVFPDRLDYQPEKTPQDYAYEAGCRYVVNYIRQARTRQEKGTTNG